jgi:hypothetical protein
MSTFSCQARLSTRQYSLSRCIAACLCLGSPMAALAATTWTVSGCGNDNVGAGTVGTLRYAAANAASGDTIDMTALTCSTISLGTGATTGAIQFQQEDLTVSGPGIARLAITGAYNGDVEADRIINHTGAGFLAISGMTLEYGAVSNPTGRALGGCLYSAGYVTATAINASNCSASTDSGLAGGGGVYARTGLNLQYSTLDHNLTYGGASGYAGGGGATTYGSFTAKYSTVSNNQTRGSSTHAAGLGGGLQILGSAKINASTISGNFAGKDEGGIDNFSYSPQYLITTITNSTISHNQAAGFIGGMYVTSAVVQIKNTTIAFNTAGKDEITSTTPHVYLAPGFATSGYYVAQAVFLQSTLIANNTISNGKEYDVSVPVRSSTNITFSGNNNLVRATFAVMPQDTIKGSCPLLGPLRDNGGLTQTHALLSNSPGIDQGNNAAGVNQDQRGVYAENISSGPYAFPRVSGALADIGAYEVQQNDVIFNTSLEGCPRLP